MKIFQNATPWEFWEVMALAAYLLGLLGICIFAYSQSSLLVLGILWLVGTASWLLSSLVGFLFGVPRVQTGEEETIRKERLRSATADRSLTEDRITPNTNLEQISDWLTKIIVGATLVQLDDLADGLETLSIAIGATFELGEGSMAGAVASGAVIVYYFASGFIWGYLWCSLRVFRAMQKLMRDTRHEWVMAERMIDR